MKLIDTHTHLYLNNFDKDRNEVIQSAVNQGVETMLLPAIDSSTYNSMMNLAKKYPANCLPMIGLHPTSVKDNYENEMKLVESKLIEGGFIAVGEIGIDLYWDSTYVDQQKDVFRRQLKLAKEYQLPAVIHTRDSFNEIYPIIVEELTDNLKGVFHCFTGTSSEANKIIDLGFSLGIGGIITFKNAGLAKTVKNVPVESIVLETDAPFLTPVPFRGKRNQSAYINFIAVKLAEVKNMEVEEIADITTKNAVKLFKLKT